MELAWLLTCNRSSNPIIENLEKVTELLLCESWQVGVTSGHMVKPRLTCHLIQLIWISEWFGRKR